MNYKYSVSFEQLLNAQGRIHNDWEKARRYTYLKAEADELWKLYIQITEIIVTRAGVVRMEE